MGDELGDFFKKSAKKKIKASNLNNASAVPATKPEVKEKKKDEEEGWEEEQITVTTLKVEVAGKLTRDEEKQDKEEETSAPAWKDIKKQADGPKDPRDEKRFPSLAKSVQSSSIHLHDSSEPKVNISTSKNHFAALDNDEDEGEETKRPKDIKPAMVQKKKGESQKAAVQREVERYKKPDKKKDAANEEDDDEAGDEPRADAKEAKKKEERKKEVKKAQEPEAAQKEVETDVKIQPDLAASKAKYEGRRKLPRKELPAEELRENKENQSQQQQSSKKKKAWVDEEDDDEFRPKLKVWGED